MMNFSKGMASGQALKQTTRAYAGYAVGLATAGMLFGSFAFITRHDEMKLFLFPVALLFLVGAVFFYSVSKRLASKDQP